MLSRTSLSILNHLLQDATWARTRLAPYAGRIVRFSVPPWRVDLAIDLRGQFAPAPTSVPDAEISLPINWSLKAAALAPLALLADTPLLPKLCVSGSAELSETLRFVFDNLHWDYEEDLAQRVGDIAAHRIIGFVKAIASGQHQATKDFRENIAEYLVAERSMLIQHDEFSRFAALVARMDEDVASLEQRVARLEPRTPTA